MMFARHEGVHALGIQLRQSRSGVDMHGEPRSREGRIMNGDPMSLFAGADLPLAHSVDAWVAGLTVRLASNSPRVVAAAARRFPSPPVPARAACHLTIVMRPGGESNSNWTDQQWGFPDADRAVVSGPGLSAALDLAGGTAVVVADEAFVEDTSTFVRTVLEGIVFTLLTRCDRHPVHAATLCVGDAALLLHGPSGVGKSTIAYVAHRAGIGVLAEDATRIQLRPALRVWGDGTVPRIHLLEHAREEFGELRAYHAERMSNDGLRKLAVELDRPAAQYPRFARSARVCLLARQNGAVSLRLAAPREIRDALVLSKEAVFDLAPLQRERVAAALSAPGGWHLTLSARAEDALPHLRSMLAEVARHCPP
jgi:hypothetical protein